MSQVVATEGGADKKSFKETLNDFSRETPFHGLAYIGSDSKTVRALWSIVVFGCFVGLMWQSSASLKLFVGQKPSTAYTTVRKAELFVPPIEICPAARFTRAKVTSLGLSDEVTRLMHLAFTSSLLPSQISQTARDQYGLDDIVSQESLSRFAPTQTEIEQILQMKNLSFDQLLNNTTYECEDVVQECYYGQVWTSGEDCCVQHQVTRKTSNGKCFLFEKAIQRSEGPGNGLRVKLGLDLKDMVNGLTYPYAGFSIRAVPNGKHSVSAVTYAPRGGRTMISVAVTKESFIPSRSNPCRLDMPSDIPFNHCMQECSMKKWILDRCTCRPWDVAFYAAEKPVCYPLELLECYSAARTASEYDLTKLEAECTAGCNHPCTGYHYAMTSSFSLFDPAEKSPSDSRLIKRLIFTFKQKKWILHDEAIVDIFHEALSVTEITQYTSVTVSDELSNIGGLLALWLGGSCLALAHLVLYCTALGAGLYWVPQVKERKGDISAESSKGKVEKISRRLAQETPFHGFAWIEMSNKARKLWSILIICCIGGLLWQWSHAILCHMQHIPSTTYTVVDKKELTIPPTQICFPSKLREMKFWPVVKPYRYPKKFSEVVGLSDQAIHLMQLSMLSSVVSSFHFSKFAYDLRIKEGVLGPRENWGNLTEEILRQLRQRNITYDALIGQAAYRCRFPDGFLIERYDRGLMFGNGNTCSREDQSVKIEPYGTCIEFKNVTQMLALPSTGLFMKLATDMRFFEKSVNHPYIGFLVKVIPPGNQPATSPVFAPLRGRTVIVLSSMTGKFLSTKSNPCVNGDPSQEPECSALSHAKDRFAMTCPCRPYDVPGSKPVCLPMELLHCVDKAGITAQILTEYDADCEKKRRNYCTVSDYSVQSSFMPYHGKYGRRDSIEARHAHVDIGFKTLRQIEIEQSLSVSEIDLAANVGALLGLYKKMLHIEWIDRTWIVPSASAGTSFSEFRLFQLGGSIVAIIHAATFCITSWRRDKRAGSSENPSQRIGELFKRFVEETHFHGPAWTVIPDKPVQILWAFVVLACCLGCSYQWSETISEYRSQLPATSYTVSAEEKLELPEFEICPPVRFSIEKTRRLGLSDNAVDLLHFSFLLSQLAVYTTVRNDHVYKNWQLDLANLMDTSGPELTQKMKALNMSTGQLLDAASFDCVDIVRECYSGLRVLSGQKCCTERQIAAVSTIGRCFKFNASTQRIGGPGYGLSVRLSLPRNDFRKGLTYNYNGVFVRPLFSGVPEYFPSYAQTNGKTSMGITLIRGRFQRSGINPCKNSEPGDLPHYICMFECFIGDLTSCACRPYDIPHRGDGPPKKICTPSELVLCFLNSGVSNLDYDAVTAKQVQCGKECHPSCDVDEHTVTTTFVPFSPVLNVNWTRVYGENDLIVDVYYDSLRPVVIEQFDRVTPHQLAAKLGGLLGLWLGGSVAAVIHALCFLCTHWKERNVHPAGHIHSGQRKSGLHQ